MKFRFRRLMTITLMIGYASVNAEVPILQPGAPGNPTKELDPETAIDIADSS